MRRFLGIVAFAFGGAVATLVFSEPGVRPGDGTFDLAFVGIDQLETVLRSSQASATVGIIVATLVAVLITQHQRLSVVASVGLLVLAGAALFGHTGTASQYVSCIAAGLVLGGLAPLTGPVAPTTPPTVRTPWRTAAFAAGAVTGLLVAEPLRSLIRGEGQPRRYADYTSSSPESFVFGSVDWVVVVASVIALVALLFVIRADQAAGTRDVVTASRPVVAAVGGCVIAVAGLVAYWWRRDSAFSGDAAGLPTWIYGYPILAAALILAVVLPGRAGTLWVAVVAVVAGRALGSVGDPNGITTAISVVTILVGAVVGRYVRQPLWGIAVLTVCAAASFAGDAWETTTPALAIFVIPAAAAFTVVAAMPSTPPVAASALGVPAVLTVVVGADYGWTAYTPLTDSSSVIAVDFDPPGDTTSTLSLITLAICVVVALLVRRRPGPTENAP